MTEKVGGVVWDKNQDYLKIKVLNQGGGYLGWFLKLKRSDTILPIGTLIELEPTKIDLYYYRPRWYAQTSQLPLPWTSNVDWMSKILEKSAILRFSLKKKLETSLKSHPNLNAFCLSALIQVNGDGYEFVHKSMRNLGLTHIFAVSGFHVSILSLFVLLACRLVKASFLQSFFVLTTILFVYAMITGFSSSVFRALVFSLILLPKEYMNQDIDRIHILSIICLVHLLIWPLEVFSIGFHLSYGITFLLLLFSRRRKNSIKLLILQTMLMQLCIYIYFLFYFQEFPLFSFLGIFITPVFTLFLGIGFALLFIPSTFCDLFFVKWILSLLEAILTCVFSYAEKLDYLIKTNIEWKLYFVLPFLLTLLVLYQLMEKYWTKAKKRLLIDDFLVHLKSVQSTSNCSVGLSDSSEIQKWELEYLLYKDLPSMKTTRVKHVYRVCKEWLHVKRFSDLDVFIDVLLNALYKDIYLSLSAMTIPREDFYEYSLEIERFNERSIGGQIVSCEHYHSLFMAYCKRNRIQQDSAEIKSHLKVVLNYRNFKNLRNYEGYLVFFRVLFLKYLMNMYFDFKQYQN